MAIEAKTRANARYKSNSPKKHLNVDVYILTKKKNDWYVREEKELKRRKL